MERPQNITDLLAAHDNTFPAYAWPGGYPMWYLTTDGGALCPTCANKERALIDAAAADNDAQWNVIAYDANWEDPQFYCDNCSQRIESAYAEDEANGTAVQP